MEWLLDLEPMLVIAMIAVLAFGESAAFLGLVVPGELALIVAGGGAALGYLDIRLVLLAAVLGAILGSWAGYAIGAKWGLRLLGWHPLRRRLGGSADRVVDHLHTRGVLVVVMSRFHSVTRALAPALAGAAGMRPRMFALANLIGAVCWSLAFGGAGYLIGQSATLISHGALVASSVIAVALLGVVLVGRRRMRGSADAFGAVSTVLASETR